MVCAGRSLVVASLSLLGLGACARDASGDELGETETETETTETDTTETDTGEPTCGDGIVDPGEACDDGNQTDADGCEADCSVPACGNGIIDPGEICYAPAVTLDVSARPLDVQMGDVDGDGNLDLVAVVQDDAVPLVSWLGDGAGSLGVAITSADDTPHSNLLGLELADLDQDGHLDAVHTGWVAILVAWGQGDGGFEPPTVIPRNDVNAVTVGRFDHDALLDIACATHEDQFIKADVYISRNLGGRNFSNATIIADEGDYYPELTAADLDGDGDDELLTYEEYGVIRVFRQTAPAMFMIEEYGALEPTTGFGIATGDLDGDAHLDVVASFPRGLGDTTRVVALLQDQQGMLVDEPSVVVGVRPWGVTITDVSSDGSNDVVAALGVGAVAVLAGDGAGGFAAPVSFPAGIEPTQVATGDLDGDSVPELAVTNDGSNSVSVFWSNP